MADVPYDVAEAFRCAWRSLNARKMVARGGLVEARAEGGLLLVIVRKVPVDSFCSLYLDDPATLGRNLFNEFGQRWWDQLTACAVGEASRISGMAALILDPSAIEDGRTWLANERAYLASATA